MNNAVGIGNRIRQVENFDCLAVVKLAAAALEKRIAGPAFCGTFEQLQMVLHILMADDRRAFTRVGELSGKERTQHAGVVAGRPQFHVAARKIGLESGIDDELNRLIAELSYGRDDLIGDLSRAGIHHHGPLIAHLHRDVAAVADQH